MAAVGIGTLIGLCLGEAVVRIAFPVINVRRDFRPGIYLADEHCGWVNRPSYKGVFLDHFAEVPVHTNSVGMRGSEPDPADLEADLRVLCLGDSNMFGRGVGDEETFPVHLEAWLQEKGHGAAVWNAGVCAYDTQRELKMLERLAPSIKPHVVILGWLSNDVSPIEPTPQVIQGYLAENQEAFDRFWNEQIEHRFWENSHLARFVSVTVRRWRHARSLERRARRNAERQLDPKRMERNFAVVRKVREATDRFGAKLIVLVYVTDSEVATGMPSATVRRFLEFAKAEGLTVVSLLEPFRDVHLETGKRLFVLRDHGHPNDAGHQLTAETVGPVVLRLAREDRKRRR